jgi:hypothetical protein
MILNRIASSLRHEKREGLSEIIAPNIVLFVSLVVSLLAR